MPTNGNTFDWAGREADLNTLVKETSKEIRVSRPMFKPWGQPNGFTGTVQAHKVSPGPPLIVDPNQALTPVELACEFELFPEQFTDDETIHTLAVEAAYRVAQAEDAVLLLGSAAAEFLKNLGVQERNLQSQRGLFQEQTGQVKQPIHDSIIQGIKGLQNKGRFGKYVAIVSLDLYQQAFKFRTNPFDAQIYEIRPLLVENGFLWGQAAPEGTGVIMSLNGDGIKLAVPMDVCVDTDRMEKNVFLRVVEQIRLLVDVPEAVVQLA